MAERRCIERKATDPRDSRSGTETSFDLPSEDRNWGSAQALSKYSHWQGCSVSLSWDVIAPALGHGLPGKLRQSTCVFGEDLPDFGMSLQSSDSP